MAAVQTLASLGPDRQKPTWLTDDGRHVNERPVLDVDADGQFFLSVIRTRNKLARNAGLTWSRKGDIWLFRSAYQIKAFWHYASDAADALLRQAFPGEQRPRQPPKLPVLIREEGNARVIAVAGGDLAAGMMREGWQALADGVFASDDIALVLKRADHAEPALKAQLVVIKRKLEQKKRRLRKSGLPFDELERVTLEDLFEIVDERLAGGGNGKEKAFLGEEDEPRYSLGVRTVAVNGKDVRIFHCADPDLARRAGFTRHPQHGWISRSLSDALKIREAANDDVELAFQRHMAKGLTRPLPDDFAIPCPPGQSYSDYQLEGIRFMASRPNSLLGDEMGTGKTIQALGLINATAPARTLVVCPAFLTWNWYYEALTWLVPKADGTPRTVAVLGKADAEIPDADVVITSYDMTTLNPRLAGSQWNLLVFDEAHYLKTERSARTQAAMGEQGLRGDRRVYMTGTPIFNRPQDLWPILHSVAPTVFPDKARFMALYAVKSVEAVGEGKEQNLLRLGSIIRLGIMLRRLKADVMADLPPKQRHLIRVEAAGSASEQERLFRQSQRIEADLEALARMGENEVNRAELLQRIGEFRREVARAKLPAAMAWIRNTLKADGEPLVIFAYHRDIAEEIHRQLIEDGVTAEILHGGVSSKKRLERVHQLQQGAVRVLVCTLDAAGVGLTMTRAWRVLFVEIDYTPAKIFQSEDRCHRRGQTREVEIYYMIIPDTIEQRITTILGAKTTVAAAALADLEPENDNDEVDVVGLAEFLRATA